MAASVRPTLARRPVGKRRRRRAPTLDEVVARARPGRDGRLLMRNPLKQALAAHGRDGVIVKQVIRALFRARHEASYPRTMPFTTPLTEEAFVCVAGRAGIVVGRKRARRLIHLAISSGLLVRQGSYTSRKWRFNVATYRLGCRIVGLRRSDAGIAGLRSAQVHTAVGSDRAVKPRKTAEEVPWWLDPMFGTPDGLPPPQARGSSRQARRLRKWRPRATSESACL